jgi:hypothetical protein
MLASVSLSSMRFDPHLRSQAFGILFRECFRRLSASVRVLSRRSTSSPDLVSLTFTMGDNRGAVAVPVFRIALYVFLIFYFILFFVPFVDLLYMGDNLYRIGPRWDQRIRYYGPLDVKIVVQIGFTRFGGILLHKAPCPTVYSTSISSHPHSVSEPSSQIPFPPGEADNDDGGQGLRQWKPASGTIPFCFCG